MIRIQVQLTPEQLEGVRQVASFRQVSMAQVVRDAVQYYLLRTMPDRPRMMARADAVMGKFSSRRRLLPPRDGGSSRP